MESEQFTLLEFGVVGVDEGCEVHVVGDHPALGCWSPPQSVPLHASGTIDGMMFWKTRTPISVPSGTAIQYKYILLKNGALHRWEDIVGNRECHAIQGPNMSLIEDELHKPLLAAPEVRPPPSVGFGLGSAAGSMSSNLGRLAALSTDSFASLSSGRAESSSADGAVMVVSYILPLIIERTEGGGWNIEWNHDSVTAKKGEHLTARKRVLWIGCPGVSVEGFEDQTSLAEALERFNCVPVFLEPALHKTFYFGFCRSFLWPTFHNVIKARCFSQKVWRAYCTVNRKFADKVIEVYNSGDAVWVHDYHLLLLPSYILRKLRTTRVGLFLHTPFPSSEIFRTISVRDELLRGMLNADLIGFHIFEYARHFLTCCKRLLGLDYEFQSGGFIGVRDHKRNVMVQVSHMGIEPPVLVEAQRVGTDSLREGWGWWHEIVRAKQAAGSLSHDGYLRAKTEGRVVLLGVEEMERLKGTAPRLLAFEMLLRTHPELRDKVMLVQVNVKARNYMPADEADYQAVRSEVLEIVERLHTDFPGALHFKELPTLDLKQRMQLWEQADVVVFSPIREGFNPLPLEAVFSHREATPAVLVISEFASCSRVLNGGLRVNPWHTEEFALALERAILMGAEEKASRQERNLQFLTSNTASAWAQRVFEDLSRMGAQATEGPEAVTIGFGLAGFRRVGMGSAFRSLDTTEVLASYRRARRRAIFLDWGGTLVSIESSFTASLVEYYREPLPAPVSLCLEELAQDPRNLLMVLSGQEMKQVDAILGSMQGASLAAEHGFTFKMGNFPGVRRVSPSRWQPLVEDADLSWKEQTLAILQAFTERTNGSTIHDKGSALTWKYDDVDPEFGSMQAKELRDHLQGVLADYPVHIIMGKGYIEVRPRGVNKGVMVDHIVSELYSTSGGIDFILCIGDDAADEYMFQALHDRFNLTNAGATPQAGAPAVFTVVVGQKPSAAQYFLNDHEEVVELCQSLRLHSTRANRNRSLNDLQSHATKAAHAERAAASRFGQPVSPTGRAGASSGVMGTLAGQRSALAGQPPLTRPGGPSPAAQPPAAFAAHAAAAQQQQVPQLGVPGRPGAFDRSVDSLRDAQQRGRSMTFAG